MITMDKLLELEGEAVEVCEQHGSGIVCYNTVCRLVANWTDQPHADIRKRLDAYYEADGNAPIWDTYLYRQQRS